MIIIMIMITGSPIDKFGSFFPMPSQDGQRICEGCKAYSYCEGCRRKIEGKETHSEGDWDDLRGLTWHLKGPDG